MEITRIITLAEQLAIKPIAVDDEAKYYQLADEVQEYELRKLIGEPLYNDMLDNLALPKYEKLIEGDTWTYGGYRYTHKGLKFVLAYLIYSKWVYRSMLIETNTGVVLQTSEYNEKASEGYIKRLSDEATQIAMDEMSKIKRYIEANIGDYP